MRQYKRKSNHHETFNATLKSNRSNRCSTESMKFSESRKKLKSLSKENEKMLQKISGVESSLCKDKMVSDYKKTK